MQQHSLSTLPVLNVLRPVPVQKERQPKENVPQTLPERERVRTELREFVKTHKPVPPLSVQSLREFAEQFVRERRLAPIYTDYVAVLLNSEIWRDSLAAVPF